MKNLNDMNQAERNDCELRLIALCNDYITVIKHMANGSTILATGHHQFAEEYRKLNGLHDAPFCEPISMEFWNHKVADLYLLATFLGIEASFAIQSQEYAARKVAKQPARYEPVQLADSYHFKRGEVE